jgi:hypothetical protein
VRYLSATKQINYGENKVSLSQHCRIGRIRWKTPSIVHWVIRVAGNSKPASACLAALHDYRRSLTVPPVGCSVI